MVSKKTNEAAIQRALRELRRQPKKSRNIAAVARKNGVERTTLSDRFHNKSKARTYSKRRRLNAAEERVVLDWIAKLSYRGFAPDSRLIRQIASRVSGQEVGQCWVPRFCKRYPDDVIHLLAKRIDKSRIRATTEDDIRSWLESVSLLDNRDVDCANMIDFRHST
jgi:transcriptional regulator with XRE-family HTH domain